MSAPEWIAVAYFLYLAGVASQRPISTGRRLGVVIGAGVIIAVIVSVARANDSPLGSTARDWMPLLYIFVGYRLPAFLVVRPDERFERRLARIDQQWLADWRPVGSRSFVELAELCYLFCYPLVPLGFGCLYLAGLDCQFDRFWTAVLLAVFPCYGLLPWLPTRPPRDLDVDAGREGSGTSRVRALNLRVLKHASVRLNTFPSGHVASAIATALVVTANLPIVGLLVSGIAVGIAAGSIIGRYHYVADVAAGAAMALAAFWLSGKLSV